MILFLSCLQPRSQKNACTRVPTVDVLVFVDLFLQVRPLSNKYNTLHDFLKRLLHPHKDNAALAPIATKGSLVRQTPYTSAFLGEWWVGGGSSSF